MGRLWNVLVYKSRRNGRDVEMMEKSAGCALINGTMRQEEDSLRSNIMGGDRKGFY